MIEGTLLADQWRQGAYRPQTVEEAVDACWPLYRDFTAAGIQVIRLGLQPDRELCAPGHILAGPFHPAFGELVKSRGWGSRCWRRLQSSPVGIII